ncbi:pectate lyase [Streptomyces sp. 4N509B]|uniref:pectate lyase n=1 Tax=Streptomyces sp. 4N509B TaxID=3457413 RepID=UPI003FD5DB04
MDMPMGRRAFTRLAAATPLAAVAATTTAVAATGLAPAAPPARAPRGRVVAAMRRAAVFMDERVSHQGAYVWNYLPDLSRTWGEMEARRTMCWVQPPGTPVVGHCMLDAYHATGEERFYRAAERTALTLARVQLPSGGWNYVHDLAGEASLGEWYETVGANGWRLEEFQHLYPNGTFDDAGTASAAQLLLRLYLERRDRRIGAALESAIDFVVSAQYRGGAADGGWPQRFPHHDGAVDAMPWPSAEYLPPWLPADVQHGMEDGDYTRHVTFNDNVMGENIRFLLMCVVALGRRELIGPVERAMAMLHRLQQPGPQAGWGLQHLAQARGGRSAGAPAGARSYEPRALAPEATQNNVRQLFDYFRMTGDHSHLDRVPEAIAWLESCPLTEQQIAENPLFANRTHPTYVEIGSNRARFVHRFGSNIRNGAYYVDHDHTHTLSHSHGAKRLNVEGLKTTYEELMSLTPAEVADLRARSPLTEGGPIELPRYFAVRDIELTDLFREAAFELPEVGEEQAAEIVAGLGDRDHWLAPIGATTNPYRDPGSGPATPYHGRSFMSTHVGDADDTSPYDPGNPPAEPPYSPREPEQGITTDSFTSHMASLVAYLDSL